MPRQLRSSSTPRIPRRAARGRPSPEPPLLPLRCQPCQLQSPCSGSVLDSTAVRVCLCSCSAPLAATLKRGACSTSSNHSPNTGQGLSGQQCLKHGTHCKQGCCRHGFARTTAARAVVCGVETPQATAWNKALLLPHAGAAAAAADMCQPPTSSATLLKPTHLLPLCSDDTTSKLSSACAALPAGGTASPQRHHQGSASVAPAECTRHAL